MLDEIKARLRELGVSPAVKGYECAALCIQKLAERKKAYKIMELYAETARELNTTSSRVERSIRHMIQAYVMKSPYNAVIFAYSADKGNPTNKDFLFFLAEEFKKAIPPEPEQLQEETKRTAELEPVKRNAAPISERIIAYIQEDNNKIDELIQNYPVSLPVSAIADFLCCDCASVRAAIENKMYGMAWKKAGKSNHGYLIPTAQFIRWYMKM